MSYAAFKRNVKVGTILHCEHFMRPLISGPRVVKRVQTNAVVTEATWSDGTVKPDVWLHWPTAKEVRLSDDGRTLTVMDYDSMTPAFAWTVTS